MTNEFWIFFKRKNCYDLVIDIYDSNYMERPREERFSELKALLKNDIMNIRRVHIQGDDNEAYLEIGKSLLAIERIVKIRHFWLAKTAFLDSKNIGFRVQKQRF